MDRLGFCLSILCAIHCLIFPLLLVLGIEVGFSFIENELLGWILLLGIVTIGFLAIILGYFKHKNPKVLLVFTAGFLLLLADELLLGGFSSFAAVLIGTILICVAHLQNLKFRQAI